MGFNASIRLRRHLGNKEVLHLPTEVRQMVTRGELLRHIKVFNGLLDCSDRLIRVEFCRCQCLALMISTIGMPARGYIKASRGGATAIFFLLYPQAPQISGMAARGRSRIILSGGRPEGPGGDRVPVTVDGEGLSALLARSEQIQKTTEDHLAGSLREQWRLLRINAELEEEVARLRERVAVLSLELDLRRGESFATPSGRKRPRD